MFNSEIELQSKRKKGFWISKKHNSYVKLFCRATDVARKNKIFQLIGFKDWDVWDCFCC